MKSKYLSAAFCLTLIVNEAAYASSDKGKEEDDAPSLKRSSVTSTVPDHEDTPLTIEQLTEKALAGDQEAQYQLGVYYSSLDGGPLNLEDSFRWLKGAAENGHQDSIELLSHMGACLSIGQQLEQNTEEALIFLKAAADLNNRQACYTLSCLYYEKDMSQFLMWAKRAAELGDVDSCTNLFTTYQQGTKDVPSDPSYALQWIIKAADLGSGQAALTLYHIFSGDDFSSENYPNLKLDRDMDRAFKYLKRSAELEFHGAEYILGISYFYGKGVEQDYQKAYVFLKKCIEGPELPEKAAGSAWQMLGDILSEGLGRDADLAGALECYRKAIETGNTSASYKLGELLSSGPANIRNYAEAVNCFLKAAEDRTYCGQAMLKLGLLYYHNLVPHSNPLSLEEAQSASLAEAVKWFSLAADEGMLEANSTLCMLYYFGMGCTKDEQKAIKLAESITNKGGMEAYQVLGLAYFNGAADLPRDIPKAIEYLTKAAQKGSAIAHYYLGYIYFYGIGTSQDYEKAAKRFRNAAALNVIIDDNQPVVLNYDGVMGRDLVFKVGLLPEMKEKANAELLPIEFVNHALVCGLLLPESEIKPFLSSLQQLIHNQPEQFFNQLFLENGLFFVDYFNSLDTDEKKERLLDHWNLQISGENPETALIVSNFVVIAALAINLSDDDPLVYTAIRYLVESQKADENNSHAIYQSLLQKRKVDIEWNKLLVEPEVVSGVKLLFNPHVVAELGKSMVVDESSVPPLKASDFAKLLAELKDAIKNNQKLADSVAGILMRTDPSYNPESGEASHELVFYANQFNELINEALAPRSHFNLLMNACPKILQGSKTKCVINYFIDLPESEAKWERIAQFMAGVRHCSVGKDTAIEDYYRKLSPQYQLRSQSSRIGVVDNKHKAALEAISCSLQSVISSRFSMDSAFMQEICKVPAETDLKDAAHFILWFKGLIGDKVGLNDGPKPDQYYSLVSKEARLSSLQEVLAVYYNHFKLGTFMSSVRQAFDTLLRKKPEDNNTSIYSSMQKLHEDSKALYPEDMFITDEDTDINSSAAWLKMVYENEDALVGHVTITYRGLMRLLMQLGIVTKVD